MFYATRRRPFQPRTVLTLSRSETGSPRRAVLPCIVTAALVMVTMLGFPPAGPAQATVLSATRSAAPVVFPGPARGAATIQNPSGADFSMHCNAYVSDALHIVGGVRVMTGTAIMATTGCGQADLALNPVGVGRFHASFGVPANETDSTAVKVRVKLVGHDGFEAREVEVTTTKAKGPQIIDLNVTHGIALVLDFFGSAHSVVYNMTLSGTARGIAPVAGNGGVVPAGATPLDLHSAAHDCNAAIPTDPITVTQVGIPAADAVTGEDCGSFTLGLPPHPTGTFVMRYGMTDRGQGGVRDILSVRLLNANGKLLRKATGVAYFGGGLQPLWLDLRGGATLNFQVSGSTEPMAITGAAILPGRLPEYIYPDRLLTGGAPGASIAIDPYAFVSKCNSYVGTSDTSVAHQPLLPETYIYAVLGCGTTGLILGPNAQGTFHAMFAVPDDAPGGAQPSVRVVVTDRTNHPLLVRTYRAAYGSAGVPIDLNLAHASVLSFAFAGPKSVLYDLTLTGTALVYDRVYPPTNPPVSLPGGVAIDPADFHRDCNTYAPTEDMLLVHEVALEGWYLSGEACGSASLTLTGTAYPRHQFAARIGIGAGEPPDTITKIRLDVLDSAGKIIRQSTWTARYGYGPQDIHISLAGGATLQIEWLTNSLSPVAVYAMTAA